MAVYLGAAFPGHDAVPMHLLMFHGHSKLQQSNVHFFVVAAVASFV